MTNTITLTELTHLLDLIKREVAASRVPKGQHRRLTKMMQDFAHQGYQLGQTGQLTIKVEDED